MVSLWTHPFFWYQENPYQAILKLRCDIIPIPYIGYFLF